VHAVVMNAETANIDTVLIAGQVKKRHGRLLFPAEQLRKLKEDVLGVRQRVMRAGDYRYAPVAQGAYP
jgi:hypothetical protein